MRQWKAFDDPGLYASGTLEGYLFRRDLAATRKAANSDSNFCRQYLAEHSITLVSAAGFKLSRYRSGEMTGAIFTTGLSGKNPLPCGRPGSTRKFTRSALVKIRRSVECAETFLRYFCTLTFAPASLQPWHLTESGTVRQDYAKWKLKKFLDVCYRHQRRLNRNLSYTWVAELQQNGNIHFHILMDQFFPIQWLTKIWAQASNSVDIQRVNNPLHAARYMRKYMTKGDEAEIHGHRYYISSQLRDTMKPVENNVIKVRGVSHERPLQVFSHVREFIKSCRADIESRGGIVLDFGFNIPVPRSPQTYRCRKTGQEKQSSGVDPLLHKQLFSYLFELTNDLPF